MFGSIYGGRLGWALPCLATMDITSVGHGIKPGPISSHAIVIVLLALQRAFCLCIQFFKSPRVLPLISIKDS